MVNAYSSASPIVAAFYEKEKEPFEIMLVSSADRAIIVKTSLIPIKNTRTSGGVTLMTMKKDQVIRACFSHLGELENTKGYRKLKIPASGQLLSDKDMGAEQLRIEP